MKARELELCEIQRWYPRFSSVSLKTIIHALPEDFIAYLQEDGLFLPRDSEALPARQRTQQGDYEEDEDYHRWDEEDDETSDPDAPSFPLLEAVVSSSIAKLGGCVFPKLNWSAPKDSAWISSHGTLRCTNFGEISLLLKASDSLVHDLSHAFDSCDDKTSHRPRQFFLALRKWYDMRPEMEFRGFVRHGLLVGVSQREVTGFYPPLLECEKTLEASVFGFFLNSLVEVFELESYTFDCYVTRAGKIKLVDFNPWGAFTLPLLFTWDELDEIYSKFAKALLSDVHLLSANAGSVNATESSNGGDKGMSEVHSLSMNVGSLLNANDGDNSSSSNGSMALKLVDGMDSPCQLDQLVCDLPRLHVLLNRRNVNALLQEIGLKPEFRIVRSNCHVQVNLRLGGGVPYDYLQTGPGSAWDDFLCRAGEELHQQNRDAADGG